MYTHNNHCHRATAHLQFIIVIIIIIIIIIIINILFHSNFESRRMFLIKYYKMAYS
jgi:t-SNARE complex subunit (syntaxin)